MVFISEGFGASRELVPLEKDLRGFWPKELDEGNLLFCLPRLKQQKYLKVRIYTVR